MSTDPTLEPGKLIDENGNYILQHQDVYNLLKYVWTGVLLPTDQTGFKNRVRLKEPNFQPALQPGITTLIENYKVVQSHCKQFKDVTYPNIVSLASDVKNYAQDVGGDPETSYYAVLLQTCKDLETEQKKPKPDQSKITEYKETINGIISGQLETIEALRSRASSATQDLRDFEEQCKTDQSNLTTTKGNLDSILTGPGGEIAGLEKELTTLRDQLAADQEEYDHDVVVACTTVTYAWVPFVGPIAAGIVAGIYGAKAVKMKEAMDNINKLISSNDSKLATDKKIVAEMSLIDKDMQTVLDLIGPAIMAIQKMIGVWDAIANDLKAIKDVVEKKEGKGNETLRKLNQSIIIKKWNTLADAVSKYQQAAYISPQEESDLGNFAKKFGDSIKK